MKAIKGHKNRIAEQLTEVGFGDIAEEVFEQIRRGNNVINRRLPEPTGKTEQPGANG